MGWFLISVVLLGFWNNYVFLDDDGFSSDGRPNIFQFYLFILVNLLGLFILRTPKSFKQKYPQMYPVYCKNNGIVL